MWPKDFRTLYCEQRGCAYEDFEEHLFWRALFPHAWLVAPVLRWLFPGFFRLDFETLERVGQTFDRREFAQDIDRYVFLSRGLHSVLRSLLLIRVSGRRLMRECRRLEARLQDRGCPEVAAALPSAR
jgi:hypothetical protein